MFELHEVFTLRASGPGYSNRPIYNKGSFDDLSDAEEIKVTLHNGAIEVASITFPIAEKERAWQVFVMITKAWRQGHDWKTNQVAYAMSMLANNEPSMMGWRAIE